MTGLKLIYDNQQIEKAITKIATQLNIDYKNKNPLLLCVLNGAIVFFGKLLPLLDFNCQVDSICVARYGKKNIGGDLKWLKYPNLTLKNKDIIIVDDILDEGITLTQIIKYCQENQASSIVSVMLADKQKSPIKADYTALNIPDKFIVGYGMDSNEKYRNLDGIYSI